MKTIVCKLIQVEKVFTEESVTVAKDFCIKCDLFPSSVELINCKTLQFEFTDVWNDDWILRVLTNLFEGLGGVDVDWDLFGETITIY